jgi:hypothetical protein
MPDRRGGGRPGEDSVRGLTGAGRSRVGVSGALRARDVSRPSRADELAAARRLDPDAPPARPQPSSGGSSPDSS